MVARPKKIPFLETRCTHVAVGLLHFLRMHSASWSSLVVVVVTEVNPTGNNAKGNIFSSCASFFESATVRKYAVVYASFMLNKDGHANRNRGEDPRDTVSVFSLPVVQRCRFWRHDLRSLALFYEQQLARDFHVTSMIDRSLSLSLFPIMHDHEFVSKSFSRTINNSSVWSLVLPRCCERSRFSFFSGEKKPRSGSES